MSSSPSYVGFVLVLVLFSLPLLFDLCRKMMSQVKVNDFEFISSLWGNVIDEKARVRLSTRVEAAQTLKEVKVLKCNTASARRAQELAEAYLAEIERDGEYLYMREPEDGTHLFGRRSRLGCTISYLFFLKKEYFEGLSSSLTIYRERGEIVAVATGIIIRSEMNANTTIL